MICKKCNDKTVKNGKHPNGSQRYYCKCGKKSYVASYSYKAYKDTTNNNIVAFLLEGVGIRFTARLLRISKTTVISRIKKIASQIIKPIWEEKHQYYELDEMRVVVGYKKKEAWITYAINRQTKDVDLLY
ncbi:MAG: insertion element IS1 protein InsB [Patiriisocius sp.]|jgi:insertion element IS1 protein InsB